MGEPAVAIRRLEEIADRAWPARRVVRGDDWEARFADGMYRRINSATVWASGDLPATVADLEAWYQDRGRPPIFKLTDASAPGLDRYLDGRGYLPDARVTVMTAGLRQRGRARAATAVTLHDSPSDEWVEAYADMAGYEPRRRRLLAATLDRIDHRAAYASIRRDGAIVATGMAVAEGAHAGVFEMLTHPDHRRTGCATAVLDTLLAWMGGPGGADVAYLQVVEGNLPARRLYENAGFEPRYQYWYRIHPVGLSTAPR